jgi:C-methyltransferase C-terminal domain/Methyltransferase domain
MSDQCPVCESEVFASLDRPVEMPILMNRVYATAAEGRAARRGPLEFVACLQCGFAWNRAFDPELIVYDEDYENDQAYSAAFRAHLAERALDVVESVGVDTPVSYLEVGCGQGQFISRVAAAAGSRLLSAEGFDPAWRGVDGEGPSGVQIHRAYFNSATANRLRHVPTVVATRHTIEHVADPVAFLRAIRIALGRESVARMWVETPCVEWIVRNRAVQDFFYEHCSLFTAKSLAHALVRAGFARPEVGHVFGGQYLWAGAVAADVADDHVLADGVSFESLAQVRSEFIRHWRSAIREAASMGRVALWGGGAKGVSFAILCDPDRSLIDHVVDVNPQKQGKFLPGSGLPIISPEESAKRSPATVFVMNVNYLAEIVAKATDVDLRARFISIDAGGRNED